MYTPPHFKVEDPVAIRSFIEENSFGLLLTVDDGCIHDTHTPFLYCDEGRLLGHIAKANPQWASWSKNPVAKVIFTGPHSYISPKYYVSKFAVPTWNYTAVSVSGRIEVITEEEPVLDFLDQLVAHNEPSAEPWVLDRNDERYLKLLSGIVVFSVTFDRVEASFKLSQNKSNEDRSKVINALSESPCPFEKAVSCLMKPER